jgi:hypothetical protein
MEEETRIKKEWNKRRASQMRELYSDEPSRAFKWVTAAPQPELSIPLEKLEEHFKMRWDPPSPSWEKSEAWDITAKIEEAEHEGLKEELLSVRGMEEAIRRRGNRSAPGLDGLTNILLKSDTKVMAKLLVQMVKIILAKGRCPKIWKVSRTVLIYKGGDKEDPRNWRPISLTSVLYRVIMARVTTCLFHLHEKVGLVSPNQKGFVPGTPGCLEHALRANSILLDAVRSKRSLFVLTVDLKDAFGSIPHELIRSILAKINLPRSLVSFIGDLYENTSTKISKGGELTSEIEILKGVRQGCPLSPLIFDLAIDAAIRRLAERNKEDGYWRLIGDENVCEVVQAYADDLILFSESREGMEKIIEALSEFLTYARIQVNPAKCEAFYIAGRGAEEEDPPEDIMIDGERVPYKNLNERIKYLGMPLGARRNPKLEFGLKKLEKTKFQLQKLVESGLRLNQKIHAVRTFVAPSLDYLLFTGKLKCKDLDALDVQIRRVVNQEVGGPYLPVDFLHTNWKDGGCSLPCLKERSDILILSSFSHLICSKDQNIRKMILNDTMEEVRLRKIKMSEEGEEQFLNWSEDSGGKLKSEGQKFDTLPFRAY